MNQLTLHHDSNSRNLCKLRGSALVFIEPRQLKQRSYIIFLIGRNESHIYSWPSWSNL